MRRLAFVLLWGLAVTSTACRDETGGRLAGDEGEHTGTTDEIFPDWCINWGLDCTGDFGNPADDFTKEKYDATVEILAAATQTASVVQVNAGHLAQANLRAALDLMGLSAYAAPFFQFLTRTAFQSASLAGESGQIVARFTDATVERAPSGLGLNLAAEVAFSFASAPLTHLDGVRLVAATSDTNDALATFALAADKNLVWSGDAMSVSGVPMRFFPAQVGLDHKLLPAEVNGLAGFSDLVDWLAGLESYIQLDETFLDVAAAKAAILVDDVKSRENLQVVLSAMAHLGIKSINPQTMTVGIENNDGRTVVCRSDGASESEVQLAGGYGAETLAKFGDGARFSFYGIKVKSKLFGPVRASFNLKRVDIYADRAVIRDIPVIGSYTYHFKNSPLAAETWSCTP